ncbi:DNA primase [Tabrizicola sp.]|uniref:DNA primase n=1 Tax=Tabrizicola sp. TaxID=2005166 RepID=UPI002735D873|nr:DNA primase [Tabrizicola sp.]MDP3194897.1 DNA primase [Tabrizicola sp.]
MSLPNGFLDELRTRVTLSSIVGRKVTWDMRKSNMAKGDFWAPCPFHQEKSASFHVDDRKGFYYCFGCHAKGDAVTFVKESENLGFMEAVEILAREGGMQMPARDPKAAERADRRTLLQQVMDEAVKFYRLQLKTSAGAEARTYLGQKRRLTEAAWDRWDIGWAPNSRHALKDALAAKGVSPDLMVASGLIAKGDDGSLYDRFRARIIFPINDARGRPISLGGRSLDPNAQAKYLNGPETELFDKGRSLFNHSPAREAAGKGKPLIVAEGYMDVIALSEAGFTAAIAPLGTAVTEEQLRMIWRIADEPIVALDGDNAGLKAAQRVIDLALPLLEAGKALRFAILPGGMDPDDLLKAQGAPAMQAVIDQAKPMVQLLWQRETEGRIFDSPERRASLDKTLRGHLARIADASIRSHYAEEMKRLRLELFGTGQTRPFQPGPFRGRGKYAPPGGALASTRSSLLAQGSGPVDEILREAVILATCILHPALIHRFESALERLDLTGEDHDTLRQMILSGADWPDLHHRIEQSAPAALDALLSRPHVAIAPPVRNRDDDGLAALCLAEELAKLEARRGARREIEDAMEDMDGLPDEGLTWRLSQAAEARHRSEKGGARDSSDLGEDRTALSRHLQSLIDSQVWVKKNR